MRFFHLKELSYRYNRILEVNAFSFAHTPNLTTLQLNINIIAYLDRQALNGLKELVTLRLDNNLLTDIYNESFADLHSLQKLILRNNQIAVIFNNTFHSLSKLSILDLGGNKIAHLMPLAFEGLDSLNNLYLDRNRLAQIDSTLIGGLHRTLQVLDLHGNFIHYMEEKFYWKFKYGYYVFRSWFGERWRRLREEEEKCTYDAFISYNSADEEWVMEQLLPNIEGSGFRLCLHHRDFEPGRNIVDNIVAAVYNSRKTVCVVSQNFLHSEWCSLEIQLASYRLFDDMQDVLLLVFLESIHERQLSAYHRMRKVMLKKTYLQWPGLDCIDPAKAQELFWKQLKRALRSSNSRSPDEEEMEGNVQNGPRAGEKEHLLNQTQMDEEPHYVMP
ncbi:hypothetical protein HF521_017334 [Silurus meridionalis]|uniref:TIR domain-containing protein n=1 Tax=Silurus meridionalis TaxID=175797 RepID=A0A8T0BRS4_SILME|nr:hypothetical protein HF521_017334 [Silurus meridionalis]